MKKTKHRQAPQAGSRPATITSRPTVDAGGLAQKVESALARGEVDSACQLLSQARPSPAGLLDRELGARAYTLQAYHRWDKPARAIGSLEQAIGWAPESAELRRLHGDLLRRSGSHKRAVAEMAEASRIAPGDPRIAYETLLTRLAAGDRDGDLPMLASVVADPDSHRATALLAAFDGDLASAERAAATSEHPVDQLIHGVLLLAQGKAAGAIPLLEGVVTEGQLPRIAQAYANLYQGIARLQLRQLAPAADALEKARALGAPVPQVQVQLAWAYQQLAISAVLESDLPAAADWFGRLGGLTGPEAAEARANTAYALGLLGQEHARVGDYDQTASLWSRALGITPGDTALRQNLAVALERAGRADEAIPLWHELVRQLPRGTVAEARGGDARAAAEEEDLRRHVRAVAHRHLADLYLDEDEVERAIDQMERALRAVPDDLDTRRGLAALLMDEGQARKAVTHYQHVVTAAPESAEDRLELGLALESAGDEQQAIEQMKRALEQQPDNPMVRSALGLALMQRATRTPGAATAQDDAQHAVELLPQTYVGLGFVAQGAVQLARGDRRGAQKSFKLAIREAPVKAVAAARVGDAYWQAGEREAAVAAWTDAMKRAKRSPVAYPGLAEGWAMAGEAARCRECLEASLRRPELWPEALNTVERISRSRKLQPFLRDVLRGMAPSGLSPRHQILLVRMLIYAGDAQGAGSLLSQMAIEAVESDDEYIISPILDLDVKFRLLGRKASLALADWLDARDYGDAAEDRSPW